MAHTRLVTKIVSTACIGGLASILGVVGCSLFQNEQVSKGQHLYAHYCLHCHGEHGRQNEGYNWGKVPDPKPKDLYNQAEMSTFKDEEIFNTISRDMKDTTPEIGDKIGDDDFAVPTMPTFKYTLSEEETWSIVAYVRTLHGMKLTYNIENRKKELNDQLAVAQSAYDTTKQVSDAVDKKASDEADKKEAAGETVEDAGPTKEGDAFTAASTELDKMKAAMANFSARPKFPAVTRPDLTMSEESVTKATDLGKRLYSNKYGCNACHSLGDEGGVVGPALDRAGIRLNATWVYRWIKNPQQMKPETRMPNLGISDGDAKAIAMYLKTLRAAVSDKAPDKSSMN